MIVFMVLSICLLFDFVVFDLFGCLFGGVGFVCLEVGCSRFVIALVVLVFLFVLLFCFVVF